MVGETFRVEGTEDLMMKLDQMINVLPEVVMDRLELHAEKILVDSKKEVPWDTTHLMQSGTVEPFEEGDLKGFEIGYYATSGTDDYNYGLKQHEDLTLNHPKPGTKAKFLEDPFNRHKGQIVPEIVSYVDGLFQQGIPSMSGMMRSKRTSLGNLGGRFV
jgi:hypothetical protein